MYLVEINMLFDTYAPLKRINKFKLKFKSKAWITLGFKKSTSVENKLLINFINKKDSLLKVEFHASCKKYRHLLSNLLKKSKQVYYDKYFERNNIKNIWKELKSLISLKIVASSVPTAISLDNGDTRTKPYHIANTFNNYFASIAETTKKSIKHSHKHFSYYLSYIFQIIFRYPCYQILKKYLKKLYIRDSIPFSITIMLSINHSLDSENNTLYRMP